VTRRHLPETQGYDPSRHSTAPYNFVPLPDGTLERREPLPRHDQADRLSGTLTYTVTALTPLYTRAAVPLGGKDADAESFFHHGDKEQPVLPGSTMRGMVRALLGVLASGRLGPVKDRRLFFRSFSGPMKELYQRRFVEDAGKQTGADGRFQAYRTRSQPAFLVRRDDSEEVVLEPCYEVRVSRRLLQSLGALYQAAAGEAGGRSRFQIPSGLQYRRVWVQVESVEPEWSPVKGREGRTSMYLWRRMVKALSATEEVGPGWKQGWLVITGDMKTKRTEVVFVPRDAPRPRVLPPRVLEEANDLDDQISYWQRAAFPNDGLGERGELHPLQTNGLPGLPVWFLEEGDEITAIGRAQNFRIPYKRRTSALQPQEPSEPVDLVEGLFGRVRPQRRELPPPGPEREQALDAMAGVLRAAPGVTGAAVRLRAGELVVYVAGQVDPRDLRELLERSAHVRDWPVPERWWVGAELPEEAELARLPTQSVPSRWPDQIKGRVRFGDLRCTERSPWLADAPGHRNRGYRVPQILASPKPTAFQNYLVQRQDTDLRDLEHYDREKGELRGTKMYWHRKLTDQEMFRATQSPGTQGTVLRPVRPGSRFCGEVRFDQLDPAELGGLLHAMQLPGGLAHRLGAGKPLGLGSVRLEITGISLCDRAARYRSWEPRAGWGTALKVDAPEVEPFREAFRELVVAHARREGGSLPRPAEDASVWDLPRARVLATLLAWDAAPAPSKTRYVTFDKGDDLIWRNRHVLPAPHQVVGGPDPLAGLVEPRQAPPGDSAPPATLPVGLRTLELVRVARDRCTARDPEHPGARIEVVLPRTLGRDAPRSGYRAGDWVKARVVKVVRGVVEAAYVGAGQAPSPDDRPAGARVRAELVRKEGERWRARLEGGKREWEVRGQLPPGTAERPGSRIAAWIRRQGEQRWLEPAQDGGGA
jgi:hypothetical protein